MTNLPPLHPEKTTPDLAAGVEQKGRAGVGGLKDRPPLSDDAGSRGGKSQQELQAEIDRLARAQQQQLGATPQPATLAATAPQTPEQKQVAEEKRQVLDTFRSGDSENAVKMAEDALKQHPDDKDLLAFVKLTQHKQAHVDQKTINQRAKELLAGLQRGDDAGIVDGPAAASAARGGGAASGAILASPIGWGLSGADAGGRALGAGAGPIAVATPLDLHARAVLRDAGAKLEIRDFAGAEAILSRYLSEHPDEAAALIMRAISRSRKRDLQGSNDDLRRAIELEPRDSRPHNLLANNLTDLGRPKEALVESERALMLNAQDPAAYHARSRAFAALGRRDDELADLGKAAALDAAYDGLYREALSARGYPVQRRDARGWAVWMGAVGTALFFFSYALFRKRGESSVRLAMRQADHEILKGHEVTAAVMRATSAPKGFKITRTLGSGGMGVVYEAVDLALQRTVALKKLRPEVADVPRERARFLKEARTVAGLKHPNIVEIHAIHEDEEGLFLVFERVPGLTLHERVEKGPLAGADAVAILRQVAAALDYAHAQGVVHQDLKPANVMVNGQLAKVMDFGIARRVMETLSTMSRAEVAGTPAYMAPEQEQGIVTPAADIYALGSCAYQVLTGSLPFPTGGSLVKAQKLYRPLADHHPALSRVEPVVGRALEPRPESRWPSASSFIEALARALA